ncbi:MAG: hypothetical protein IKM11_04545 [Oscillospiraceae bacterium]|nr:hypothetical protein [Oscillospiraceae bacterium]
MMNEKQRSNEEKIFKAIQDLKDSVFGLKQPYIRYCYTYTEEEGYRFCVPMADAFADELSMIAQHAPTYCDELSAVMPLFFRMIPRLLAAICASGDWIFVSFRKLAETALKDTPEEKSVLERIVESHRAVIDETFPNGEFWPDYEAFCGYMGRVDNEAFYRCAKNTVEKFLDERQLNVLDSDRATAGVVARISRLAAAIERDLSRREDEV